MNYERQWDIPVAEAPANVRGDFIRKTYAHLGAAVLLFVGLEYYLFSSGAALSILQLVPRGYGGLLLTMLLFMGASYLAQWFAEPHQSRAMQYAGLGLYVLTWTVMCVPLLFAAARYSAPNVIPTAGLYTAIVFGGTTGVVFLTGKDFSFLRGVLSMSFFVIIGVIVCAALFGFNLGTVFSAVMIAFAVGYILHDTSNVLHRYAPGSHVGAALQLFASIVLLFIYILRIVMDRR